MKDPLFSQFLRNKFYRKLCPLQQRRERHNERDEETSSSVNINLIFVWKNLDEAFPLRCKRRKEWIGEMREERLHGTN